jgi:hypothetical protein
VSKLKIAAVALAIVAVCGLIGWLLLSGPKSSVTVTANTAAAPVEHQLLPRTTKEQFETALSNPDMQKQWEVLWRGTADAYKQAQAPVVPPGAKVVFDESTFVAQGNYAQVQVVAKGLDNQLRLQVHLVRDSADQPWKILRMEAK